MDAWDLARREHRPEQPMLFLDGTPAVARTDAERALRQWSFVATRPSAGLCVRDGRAWTFERGAPWREREGDPWELLRELHEGLSGLKGSRADREGLSGLKGSRAARDGPTGPPLGPNDPNDPPAPPLSPDSPSALEPPFRSGVAGLISYDAARLLERLPERAADDTRLPQILMFRFDEVAAVPASDAREPERAAKVAVASVRPRTEPKDFETMVVRAQERIRAGDVFQVNLSHRLEARATLPPIELYARLRDANPAPFGAYFESGPLPWDAEGFSVLSSSPERLFRLERGRLEARPIAGTRPRSEDAAQDAALAAELRADGKEQAEHVMLVDLARNDLGRVARFGSVKVHELLHVESYRTVHHLVSVVEAELAEGKDAVDALKALFPGGTITGAPKVRSMEIIEELEPVRRGVYTGSLGWWSSEGDCDLNILIRTLLVQKGEVHLQVGAGIVDESVPAREYQETLAKALGLLRALGAAE